MNQFLRFYEIFKILDFRKLNYQIPQHIHLKPIILKDVYYNKEGISN